MGKGTAQDLREQLENVRPNVRKADDSSNTSGPESTDNLDAEGDAAPVRRRERRASNEPVEDDRRRPSPEYSEEERKELFNAEKRRLNCEAARAEEETRHLKADKFLCRSIGGAILMLAGSAFAVVAHSLTSGEKK